jgi:myo-inositol catabolism protein IolC
MRRRQKEGLDAVMAQAAVKSAVSRGTLIGRPAELPGMKRKTPSELRVMPLLSLDLHL